MRSPVRGVNSIATQITVASQMAMRISVWPFTQQV